MGFCRIAHFNNATMHALKFAVSRDMSTPSPLPPTAPRSASGQGRRRPRWLPWILPAAVVLGGLLFLLVWSIEKEKVFYTVPPAANTETQDGGQVKIFEPLPTPQSPSLTQGSPTDSLLPAPPAAQAPRPQQPAIEPPTAHQPAPPPVQPTRQRISASTPPVPIHQPAPRYPRNALRDGIGGVVQLQVDVGPDGVPTSVSLIRSSGSRELDRAASDVVRRWRFQPATENGQPSVGRVTVPIQFTPN
ncbi:energy transducer TonB [Lysobacteraceae bacterium NML71-0210]|nr:energy transducer TonB [Xanthomonadaceae bacterium NML71-0210]